MKALRTFGPTIQLRTTSILMKTSIKRIEFKKASPLRGFLN
jgi:hypothetical protein